MVEWLLRFGLPLDPKNAKGETLLDVATPATRAVMERWLLDQQLGGDASEPAVQRRRL